MEVDGKSINVFCKLSYALHCFHSRLFTDIAHDNSTAQPNVVAISDEQINAALLSNAAILRPVLRRLYQRDNAGASGSGGGAGGSDRGSNAVMIPYMRASSSSSGQAAGPASGGGGGSAEEQRPFRAHLHQMSFSTPSPVRAAASGAISI